MSKEIFRKYTELFSTELGKEVLEDLQTIWKEETPKVDHGSLAYSAGRRSVLRDIEAMINKGQKQ